MTAALPQIEDITLDKALLRRGVFAAAEGLFLPWQAYCPPPAVYFLMPFLCILSPGFAAGKLYPGGSCAK